MTETSSLLATYPIPNTYQVTALPTSVSPLPNGNLSPANAPEEEEEYTIKCVCGYNDDDGATVFCDKCETWQHILCYYDSQQVPEIHFCTDCLPKGSFLDINVDKARDRQRRARELLEGGGDRKVRRPVAKTQKKKHRDTISTNDQPNGWTNHDRHDSLTNGRDQPPPSKKTKTTHRASGSIASLNGESRKRAYSNVQSYPSPSKSPQELYRSPIIPRYTSDFLELYQRDEGNTLAKDNEHTISGSQASTTWKTDPSLVANHTENALNDRSPFIRAEGNWDETKLPPIRVETIQGKDLDGDGRKPTWKFVRLQSNVRKNTIVGEIRGQIGTLEEYCHQLTGPNRWKDLSHPDPFVFFHPHMDIYIDSRRSGTEFRYIRRSCDPNVTLRSYITADDEIHHCFVANKDILAGTELTAMWYLTGPLFVNEALRDNKEQLFQERCDYISRILANFGDCACGLPKCRLEGFDRRSSSKLLEQPPKLTAGRKKKVKVKHVVSPLSTGQATNSRANSETIKGQEEDDDQKSTSGSSRTDARSRDLTPQGGALLDRPPMLDEGLTAREKRKIEALEKSQKELLQKGEKKQKKRPSGGPAGSSTNPGSTKHYGFTSTPDGKRYSGSPPDVRNLKDITNRATPSKLPVKRQRPVYKSAGVQTDPEPCEIGLPPLKRRKFCTPTQRLLKKLMQQRAACLTVVSSTSPSLMALGDQSGDVEMRDATTSPSMSPSTYKSAALPNAFEDGIKIGYNQMLPSQAAHTQNIRRTFKAPGPRLNLSTLPPIPVFPSSSSTVLEGSSAVTTPNVGINTVAQSPGSLAPPTSFSTGNQTSGLGPSPAKKKLSLGDYMSRRKESATPSTEKPAFSLPGVADDEKQRRPSDAVSDSDPPRPMSSDGAQQDRSSNDEVKKDTNYEKSSEVASTSDSPTAESKAEPDVMSNIGVASIKAHLTLPLPQAQNVPSPSLQADQDPVSGHTTQT